MTVQSQQQFGARVRERRRKLGWTQAQLAARLGWYQPDVSDLEQGHHSPTLDTIKKVSDALKVSIKKLFSD